MAELSWWCTRGGLVTVVDAHSEDGARVSAAKAFGHRKSRTKNEDLVTVREATGSDLALWAALLGQQRAGVDGARVVPLPDEPTVEEPSLFGVDG